METRREKHGSTIGSALVILPGMIASGLVPAWDLSRFVGRLAIAMVGGAIGGAIATPRTLVGLAAGAAMGAGTLLGMEVYVLVRGTLTGHDTYLQVELVIGAAPGGLVYYKWGRDAQA